MSATEVSQEMPTNPERFERAEELFHAAAALAADARAPFLDQACGADDDLRRDVESLLVLAAQPSSFLDEPLVSGMASVALPQTIGAYRLLREIGRGGMGRVYEAEQEGVGRHVAIKVLRPAMASAVFLRRFRAERQILAGLEHAGIARLYDAGTTDDGLPYLVMEHVHGANLLAYCHEHRLGLTERLRLFERVCEAVRYAHQHLVVHRDLKPSNILVTKEGEPKLLDFGIAKLLSEDIDASEAGATVTGLRLMTPEYASPEQVRGEPVTTASDVYSLGIVLYELLTLRKPYRLSSRSQHELERVVLDQTPPRPSTAVRSRDESIAGDGPPVLGSRSRHSSALRGDLDNIVLKALAKDAAERYATADELVEDLRRYLTGLPVRARPDTVSYRARKFVQRHQWSVTAGVLVAMSLVVALAVTLNAVIEARRERDLAAKRLADVRRLANVFLFDVDAKIRDISGTTEARELLVRTGLGYLDGLAADAGDDQSLLRELANGYDRLGDVQGAILASNLGQSEAALVSYQKASSLRQRLTGQPAAGDAVLLREAARGELKLAQALFRVARIKEARDHAGAGVDLLTRATAASGEIQIDQAKERADALVTYGFLVAVNDDIPGALKPLREAVAYFESLPAAQLTDLQFGRSYALALFRTIQALGELPNHQGLAEAIDLAPRVIEIDRRLLAAAPQRADLHRGLGRDLAKLGDLLASAGRHSEALGLYAESKRLGMEEIAVDARDRLARRSLDVVRIHSARSLLALGRLAEARDDLQPAVADITELFAEDPKNVTIQVTFADTAIYYGNLVAALSQRGTRDAAALARAQTMLARAIELLAPLVQSKTLTGEEATYLALATAAQRACEAAAGRTLVRN